MAYYSMDSLQDSCYEGTNVLINKFNIHDENKLDEIETIIVTSKSAEWLLNPQNKQFDFNHYKQIHRFLFSDIYEWAGEVRKVNMSKKGTAFCDFNQIEKRAEKIFLYLKNMNYFRNTSHEEFVDYMVDFYCTTNELHPFREGNGRTQRTFLMQLAECSGFHLDFSLADDDLLMIATIQSANGIYDNLKEIFNSIISR